VPEAERLKLFWAADRELADAWLKLHSVSGQAQPASDGKRPTPQDGTAR